jgi:hypothetical protein
VVGALEADDVASAWPRGTHELHPVLNCLSAGTREVHFRVRVRRGVLCQQRDQVVGQCGAPGRGRLLRKALGVIALQELA